MRLKSSGTSPMRSRPKGYWMAQELSFWERSRKVFMHPEGTQARMRWSQMASHMVMRPPVELPRHPSRAASTSGRCDRTSRAAWASWTWRSTRLMPYMEAAIWMVLHRSRAPTRSRWPSRPGQPHRAGTITTYPARTACRAYAWRRSLSASSFSTVTPAMVSIPCL